MERLLKTIITLTVLLVSVPMAEAIDITRAEVQNGVAVVHGNKAAKQATISWETGNVGQTTNGGSFSFLGVVPADCVGQLSIGAVTIAVALANCTATPSYRERARQQATWPETTARSGPESHYQVRASPTIQTGLSRTI